jgi:predicted Holliday junction resolvase-like endonuclease
MLDGEYYLITTIIMMILFIIVSWLLIQKDALVKAMQKKNDKILHDKLSSEIRVGKIGENMAPFLNEWPYDPSNFRFLGSPIDGVQFTDDEILLVEIKTGKSRLTKSQRNLRDLVKDKKVNFVTFRVGENGCKLKKVNED